MAKYPTLIGQDLISVQPMAAPTGNLFYVDFKYKTEEDLYKEKIEERNKKINDMLNDWNNEDKE